MMKPSLSWSMREPLRVTKPGDGMTTSDAFAATGCRDATASGGMTKMSVSGSEMA